MNSREIQELQELYSEVYEERAARKRKPSKSVDQLKAEINAKNPTEEGITGKQIPKKKWKSAPKRHEFEKERRLEKKKREGSTGYAHSGHLMGGSTRTMAHNLHNVIDEGAAEAVVKAADWVRRGKSRHDQAVAQHKEKERQKKIPYAALTVEEIDLYDAILSHLFDEGYASTEEAAIAIMVNMSEEWKENIVEEVLDERRYDRDEPLPGSGKTPREKMERQRGKHGANYLLRGRETKDRNDQARTSHFNRASTMDTVKAAQDRGEEPSKDPKWKNTIAARRRPRASYEVPNERPGGLRAGNTKAGGHRTLKRKEG